MLLVSFALALALGGCGRGNAENTTDALARDPERLKAALRECRAGVKPADDPGCRAAAEAWRRRFFGNQNPGAARPSALSNQVPAPAESLESTPWMAGS